jgi:uncharacterized protein YcsI (UPF0317 family)
MVTEKPTCGTSLGNIQASVVILPSEQATDFINFCMINATALPLNFVGRIGDPILKGFGSDIDIRADLPYYRIYKNGDFAGASGSIENIWNDDHVAICIGCSFSFEGALIRNGIPVRHIDENKNVPMFNTDIQTRPFGPFCGPVVVSMRPIKRAQLDRVIEITSVFGRSHGAPIHVGRPADIGIADINKPDYGNAVNIEKDEVPVFWGCGVTALTVMEHTKLPLSIVHEPGYMLVTDAPHENFADPLLTLHSGLATVI